MNFKRLGRTQPLFDLRSSVFWALPMAFPFLSGFVHDAAASWFMSALLFSDAALSFLATCSVCPLFVSHVEFPRQMLG